MRLRLGTRGSQLARTQSEMIAAALSYAGHEVDLMVIKTDGDAHRGSLRDGGTGLFVARLRQALLASDIDVAVHSLKDLPTDPVQGLVIAAVSQRAEASDALCARPGLTLASLPAGARVGTGSPRRTAQLLALRPDLEVVDIRGNVDQRLSRVHGSASTSADLHAVVLAVAGLTRLGRADAISEVLNFLPAPGQGALAVECRSNDPSVRQALALLEDPRSRAATTAERAVLAGMDAGCSAPIGAQAVWQGDTLALTAAAWSPEGHRVVRTEQVMADGEIPEQVGDRAARELLRAGAAVLIEPDTEPEVLTPSQGRSVHIVDDEIPDQAGVGSRAPAEPAKPIRTIHVALDQLDEADSDQSDDDQADDAQADDHQTYQDQWEADRSAEAAWGPSSAASPQTPGTGAPTVIFDDDPDPDAFAPPPRPRESRSPVVVVDAEPEPAPVAAPTFEEVPYQEAAPEPVDSFVFFEPEPAPLETEHVVSAPVDSEAVEPAPQSSTPVEPVEFERTSPSEPPVFEAVPAGPSVVVFDPSPAEVEPPADEPAEPAAVETVFFDPRPPEPVAEPPAPKPRQTQPSARGVQPRPSGRTRKAPAVESPAPASQPSPVAASPVSAPAASSPVSAPASPASAPAAASPGSAPAAASPVSAPAARTRPRMPEPPSPPPVTVGVAANEVVPGATSATSLSASGPPSRQPLKDRTIIVPRLDGKLTQSLRLAGATVTAIPLTRRRLLEVPDPVRPADWLVLTSANGVAALRHAGHHLNEYGERIAVVGPATAQAVRAADADVDLEPIKGSSAAALAAVFPPGPGSVVLASSALAERTLAERISELGWTVYRVPTYTTEAISPKELPADLLAQWPSSDAVVLTSGSVARAVRELLGVPGPHTKVIALGEATAAMARQAGLPVHGVAATPDSAGVIGALSEALGS